MLTAVICRLVPERDVQSEDAVPGQIRWAVLRAPPAKATPAPPFQLALEQPAGRLGGQGSVVLPAKHMRCNIAFHFAGVEYLPTCLGEEKVLIPADSVNALILTCWKPANLYEYGDEAEERQAQAYKLLCTHIPSYLRYHSDLYRATSSVGEPFILSIPLLQSFSLKVPMISWLVTARVGDSPDCVPTVAAQGYSHVELHLGYKIKALQEIAQKRWVKYSLGVHR